MFQIKFFRIRIGTAQAKARSLRRSVLNRKRNRPPSYDDVYIPGVSNINPLKAMTKCYLTITSKGVISITYLQWVAKLLKRLEFFHVNKSCKIESCGN